MIFEFVFKNLGPFRSDNVSSGLSLFGRFFHQSLLSHIAGVTELEPEVVLLTGVLYQGISSSCIVLVFS